MKNQSKFFSALLLLMVFLISVSALLLDNNAAAMAASHNDMREEIRQQLINVKGTLVETRINGWIRINQSKIPLPVLLEKARELLPLLGEDVQAQIQSNETQNYRQVKIGIREEGVDYTILLYNSTLPDEKSGKCETYVIMDAVLNSDSIVCESKAYEMVEVVLSQFEDPYSIGTTYTATIPEKLKEAEMEQTGRRVFAGLNADITEFSRDTDWISLTGYSNQIGGGLESVHGRFNLNVALRYHSHENKTYICLGTPVISIPY